MMKKILVTIIVGTLAFSACAPIQKLLGKKTKLDICYEKNDSLQNALSQEKTKNTELSSSLAALKDLEKKHSHAIDSLTALANGQLDSIAKLTTLNDELVKKQERLSKDNATEAKKIMSELQNTREDLQKREDKLTSLQADLEKERARLEKLNSDIAAKDAQLRNLQSMLHAKDSAANALKSRLSAALKGFEGNGLSINIREGKIYVSLDEQLLFELGKYEVNPKGADALKKLASVLEKNPDINILVEGHTDNTGSAKFNWKLSTDRSLAISSILLENPKVDGKRLTAAGRGQFSPIDDNSTVQGRTKNRRCEIILSPKLDELYKLIEN
jgi:chemotaxis protein MotB